MVTPTQQVHERLTQERELHRSVVLRWFTGAMALLPIGLVASGAGEPGVRPTLAVLFLTACAAHVLAWRRQIEVGYLLIATVFVVTLFLAHSVLLVSELAPAYVALLVVVSATLFPRRRVLVGAGVLAAAVLGMRLARPVDDGWIGATVDAIALLVGTALVVVVDRRRVERDEVLLHEALARIAAVSAQAEASAAEARRANELKSDFLARVSHELRTPINAILGYAELIAEEDALADEVRADIARISTSGRNLLALVERVLDLARVEAGRLEVHPVEVPLDEVVEPPLRVARRLAQSTGNLLIVEVPAEPVPLDVDLVRQVLLNLLANAVRFTERGTIWLTAVATPEAVTFEVRDTGIGIAAAVVPTVHAGRQRGRLQIWRHRSRPRDQRPARAGDGRPDRGEK